MEAVDIKYEAHLMKLYVYTYNEWIVKIWQLEAL